MAGMCKGGACIKDAGSKKKAKANKSKAMMKEGKQSKNKKKAKAAMKEAMKEVTSRLTEARTQIESVDEAQQRLKTAQKNLDGTSYDLEEAELGCEEDAE